MPIDLPPIPDELRHAIELERRAPPPGDIEHGAVLAQIRATLAPRRTRWDRIRGRIAPNVALGVAFALAVGAIVIVRQPRTYDDPNAVHSLDSVTDSTGSERTRPPPRPIPLGPDRSPVPPSRTPVLAPRIDLPLLPPAPVLVADAGLVAATDASVRPPRDTTAEEDDVLRMARVALAHGDHAAALTAIRLHIARFPFGHLAEERETLAIETLVRLGHVDQARARADAFRSAHPDSLALHVIDELVAHTSDAGQAR